MARGTAAAVLLICTQTVAAPLKLGIYAPSLVGSGTGCDEAGRLTEINLEVDGSCQNLTETNRWPGLDTLGTDEFKFRTGIGYCDDAKSTLFVDTDHTWQYAPATPNCESSIADIDTLESLAEGQDVHKLQYGHFADCISWSAAGGSGGAGGLFFKVLENPCPNSAGATLAPTLASASGATGTTTGSGGTAGQGNAVQPTDSPMVTDACGAGMKLAKLEILNATSDQYTDWPSLRAWCDTESTNMQSTLCAVGTWSHSSSWACKCCELKCCVPEDPTSPPQGPTAGAGGVTSSPAKGSSPATTDAPRTPPASNTPPVAAGPVEARPKDPDCGNGYKSTSTDCCTCWQGYKLDAVTGKCDGECADGFMRSQLIDDSGDYICTDGRPMSDCSNGLQPPFGCGSGVCSVAGSGYVNRGRHVFPCQSCTDSMKNPDTMCQFWSRADGGKVPATVINKAEGGDNTRNNGCLPKGARMVAPFPYAPVTGKKFSLIVVGCDISVDDQFIIIPAFKFGADGKNATENTCESSSLTSSVTKLTKSTDTRGKEKVITIADGAGGWFCDGCAELPNKEGADAQQPGGMSEVVITDINYEQNSLDSTSALGDCPCIGLGTDMGYGRGVGTPGEGPFFRGSNPECPCDELQQYRRLCRNAGTTKNKNGEDRTLWRTVDAHTVATSNETGLGYGTQRTKTFYISRTLADADPRGAAMMGAGLGDAVKYDGLCCDGLLLGSSEDDPCIPLWAFLLIWLLLCCLLALLAFLLHRNLSAIDADKNNNKFNNFAMDKELAAFADGCDDDDDDI